MKKIILSNIALFLASCFYQTHAVSVHSDQQAYDYCVRTHNAFIAIVWPKAQGKEAAIERALSNYGTIIYKKQKYFTYQQAYALLKDAHPHVLDIKQHMKLYFPSGALAKPARIYLLNLSSLDVAVQAKHAVRRLFDLGYTSIHINDYHHELVKLADFFFTRDHHRNSPWQYIDDISGTIARALRVYGALLKI